MNRDRKHILIVTPGFPSSKEDDWCVPYLANYVSALKEYAQNIQITVVSIHFPFKNYNYNWKGIQVHAIGGRNRSFPFKIFSWIKALKRCNTIHKENPIDHIHAFWYKDAAVIGGQLAKRWSVPLTVTFMGTDVLSSNNYLRYNLVGKAQFICVSQRHQEILFEQTGIQADYVIPWGVPTKDGTINEKRDIDLLFVGYLRRLKNFELFLEIIKVLSNKIQHLKIHVVGEDYSNGYWQQEIKRAHLSKIIHLEGLKSNSDTLELMRRTKIMVHTSDFEAQGYAMLEALSLGAHVVAKKVGIVRAADQFHIAETKSAFINTIEYLLTNPLKHQSYVPYGIEKTLNSYLERYGIS